MLKIWTGGVAAVVLAAVPCAHAQDAVQWRVEDGGNGHWYQVGPDPDSLSWDDSRAFAIMQGGDLIALSSQDEWDYLRTVVLKAFPIASFPRELGAYLPIGLLQSAGSVEPAEGWEWIDGSGFDVPWRYNEPNNSPGASCDEQWGQIHRDVANGFFVNDYCDVALPQWCGIEWSADCNGDGIVDYGQILDGSLNDVDDNGVPDCCDAGRSCLSNAVQWRLEDGGNGHWYEAVPFNGVVLSWEESLDRALQRGGYLATFASEEETFGFLDSDGEVNLSEAWIGLRQNLNAPRFFEPDGGWEWITEEEVAWTNWDNGEPNNATNNQFGGEHWCTLRIAFGTRGKWNDYVPDYIGGARQGYIIEWSADCNGDGIVDYGQILDGTFTDENGNGVPDCCDEGIACECTGDLNSDGVVGPPDIGVLLSGWGTDGSVAPGSDINEDGTVDGFDLSYILGWWGPCR